jgi:anti-sigma B factor antagonist
MTGQFEVTAEKLSDGTHELRLLGELDQATAPELEQPLQEALAAENGGVLLNLTDCEFIDSTGIAVLVRAHDRVKERNGRRFVLCCPHSQVRRLLEITGVDQCIELHESRDEALAAIQD